MKPLNCHSSLNKKYFTDTSFCNWFWGTYANISVGIEFELLDTFTNKTNDSVVFSFNLYWQFFFSFSLLSKTPRWDFFENYLCTLFLLSKLYTSSKKAPLHLKSHLKTLLRWIPISFAFRILNLFRGEIITVARFISSDCRKCNRKCFLFFGDFQTRLTSFDRNYASYSTSRIRKVFRIHSHIHQNQKLVIINFYYQPGLSLFMYMHTAKWRTLQNQYYVFQLQQSDLNML